MLEKYGGLKLPAVAVLRDFLRDEGVSDEWLEECISLFIVNFKFAGVLRDVAGAERLLKPEHALEEAVKENPKAKPTVIAPHVSVAGATEWDKKRWHFATLPDFRWSN